MQLQSCQTCIIADQDNAPLAMFQLSLTSTLMNSEDGAAVSLDDDDDDVIMTQEEVGIKCPYTQQVMKEPIRNKICNHNYEGAAIQEFMLRKKGMAK